MHVGVAIMWVGFNHEVMMWLAESGCGEGFMSVCQSDNRHFWLLQRTLT